MTSSDARSGWPADAEFAEPMRMYRHQVYGLVVESDIRLNNPFDHGRRAPDVRLHAVSPECLAEACAVGRQSCGNAGWYVHERLSDGRVYLRWQNLFAFLISADGHRVWMAGLGAESMESFEAYLLGQALGWALTLSGQEPLHATVVHQAGQAIGLLGGCGAGKSTTAAYLLQRGASLVTDDLLRITFDGSGTIAHPGPQRIKLVPDARARFMADVELGVDMNARSGKYILSLPRRMRCDDPVRLARLYSLDMTSDLEGEPRADTLSGRDALIQVVASAFNDHVTDAARLERQFRFADRLVRSVPVQRVTYGRGFNRLPAVARLMGLA